jgi:hypothetical protein
MKTNETRMWVAEVGFFEEPATVAATKVRFEEVIRNQFITNSEAVFEFAATATKVKR